MRRGKFGRPPPRRQRTGWSGRAAGTRSRQQRAQGLLLVAAICLFVLGLVGGFAWAQDRQLRGGLLTQRAEAAQRPDWVELQALPDYVPAAFLAVVDPAFLEAGRLRTGETGTTLARELVRQVHLLPGGVEGEARELVLGPVLEHRLPKRELLELYLNRVYLGEDRGYPVFGVHHAAREFFDKRPDELTLSEAATLAGLLLEPRIEDPAARVGAVGVRRNEVLQVMRLGELISAEQYRAALRDRLAFQPGLDQQPATRPADWTQEPPVLRVPAEALADSAAADAAN